jgi:hypothetical protein
MPLLRLKCAFGTTGQAQINLKIGSIPAQPLILRESIVMTDAVDTTADYFVVELPFLNDFDINTNGEVTGIPIYIGSASAQGGTTAHRRNTHDITFMPSKDIPQDFVVKAYEDGSAGEGALVAYTAADLTIELLFEYRRPALF